MLELVENFVCGGYGGWVVFMSIMSIVSMLVLSLTQVGQLNVYSIKLTLYLDKLLWIILFLCLSDISRVNCVGGKYSKNPQS